MKMKNAIIIPAYKEAEGLPVVLEKVYKIIDESYEVIVVDDGSTDKTGKKSFFLSLQITKARAKPGQG